MAVTPTYASFKSYPLLATVLTSILYGIGLLLAAQYFRTYAKHDRLYVKVFVVLILLSSTLQIVFTTYGQFFDFIINFESNSIAGPIPFSTPGEFMCVYLTTFFAQVFFTIRIWNLTSRIPSQLRWSVLPILALALLQFVAGSIQVHLEVISETYGDLSKHNPVLRPVTAIQGAATAACDVAITLTLCTFYYVYGELSTSSASLVDRLVVTAIQRAAATSICAILSVSLYYGMRGSYRFVVPCLMTGQLYLLSTLSVLMTKEALREAPQDPSGEEPAVKEYQSEKSV